MKNDILFLLKPDFFDGGEGPFFCPECAEVQGLLSFYPKLAGQLDVRWADFQRPRLEVIQFTGEEHQGCPVLILGEKTTFSTEGLTVCNRNGHRFISGSREIAAYLARAYGSGRPH